MTTQAIYRKANERFRTKLSWLDGYHSFSFGRHYDPQWTGFSKLCVINEDFIAPGQGFGTHPHKNMEIISYVIDGELEHKDSMGNGGVIKSGEFQYMSAGSGVSHSEFNPSQEKPVHLLQIWIEPKVMDAKPRYQHCSIKELKMQDGIALFAGSAEANPPCEIFQDAEVYYCKAAAGQGIHMDEGRTGNHTWVQVIGGEASIAGRALGQGDGMGIIGHNSTTIEAVADSEFLVFQLS